MSRKNYEMTSEDLSALLDAMRPVPMIALQFGTPISVQERANDAWAVLGKKMGFDPMTVQPTGRGDRFFSAEQTDNQAAPSPKPRVFRDGDSWCATWPDFISLQESHAGFGDTPEDAIINLQAGSQP